MAVVDLLFGCGDVRLEFALRQVGVLSPPVCTFSSLFLISFSFLPLLPSFFFLPLSSPLLLSPSLALFPLLLSLLPSSYFLFLFFFFLYLHSTNSSSAICSLRSMAVNLSRRILSPVSSSCIFTFSISSLLKSN